MKRKLFFAVSAVISGSRADVADVKDFLVTHNTFRCLHDVPFLEWSDCVAQSAQTWADRGIFKHSDAYDLKPCAGPSGENLAQGHPSVSSAVRAWYNERPIWEKSAKNSFVSSAGHFTAMMWKGLKFLGCGRNDALYVCRYKGDDDLNCNTPNMGGCYTQQVPSLNTKFKESDCYEKALAHFNQTVMKEPTTTTTTTTTTKPSNPITTTTRRADSTSSSSSSSSSTTSTTTLPYRPPPPPVSTTTSVGKLGCAFENAKFDVATDSAGVTPVSASSAGNCLFQCLLRGSACEAFAFEGQNTRLCHLYSFKPASVQWRDGWLSGFPVCNLDDYAKYTPSTTSTTTKGSTTTTTRSVVKAVTALEPACTFDRIDFHETPSYDTSYFVSTPLSCLNKCLADTRCVSFTHVKGLVVSRCHLKASLPAKAESRSSATSGTASCYLPNVSSSDGTSNDDLSTLRSVQTARDDPNYTPHQEDFAAAGADVILPHQRGTPIDDLIIPPVASVDTSSQQLPSSSTPISASLSLIEVDFLSLPFEAWRNPHHGLSGKQVERANGVTSSHKAVEKFKRESGGGAVSRHPPHILDLEDYKRLIEDRDQNYVLEGIFEPVAPPLLDIRM
eukprot:GDKK01056161.1.p1 GENE.GDKK01056161.1~~GDKK01056161.1.p1  ORF type:complete len:615 (+),score=97.39 GDKK01056161.1:140-1984(+)